MSKVLMGIAAAIVLAGAVFAVVHFSARPGEVAFTPQNGWVPFVAKQRGPVHLVGTYGAWEVLCRDDPPGKSKCVVSLAIRNTAAPKEFLNFRLQNVGAGEGAAAMAVVAFRHGHSGQSFTTVPGETTKEDVAIKVDRHTTSTWIRQCMRGVCFAVAQLDSTGLNSILSARTLVIGLAATNSAKAVDVYVPTEGLKDAYRALRQQPA
jgi:invasion protein IalB